MERILYRPKLEKGKRSSEWTPCSIWSSSLIKQTADQITLEVEEGVGDLRTSVGNLTVRATEIEQSVSAITGDVSALKVEASGITSTVSSLSGQMESNITQTAEQISLMVTKSDLEQVGIKIDGDNSTISAIADKFTAGGFSTTQDAFYFTEGGDVYDNTVSKKAIVSPNNFVLQDKKVEANNEVSYYSIKMGKPLDGTRVDNVIQILQVNHNTTGDFFGGNNATAYISNTTFNSDTQPTALETNGGIRVNQGSVWINTYDNIDSSYSSSNRNLTPTNGLQCIKSNNNNQIFYLPTPSLIAEVCKAIKPVGASQTNYSYQFELLNIGNNIVRVQPPSNSKLYFNGSDSDHVSIPKGYRVKFVAILNYSSMSDSYSVDWYCND